MKCEQYSDQMSDRLEGGLSSEDTAAFDAHLEACPVCREAYQQLETAVRGMNHLGGLAMPPAMRERIQSRLKNEIHAPAPAPTRSRFSPMFMVRIAAVLAVVVLGGVLVSVQVRDMGAPQKTADRSMSYNAEPESAAPQSPAITAVPAEDDAIEENVDRAMDKAFEDAPYMPAKGAEEPARIMGKGAAPDASITAFEKEKKSVNEGLRLEKLEAEADGASQPAEMSMGMANKAAGAIRSHESDDNLLLAETMADEAELNIPAAKGGARPAPAPAASRIQTGAGSTQTAAASQRDADNKPDRKEIQIPADQRIMVEQYLAQIIKRDEARKEAAAGRRRTLNAVEAPIITQRQDREIQEAEGPQEKQPARDRKQWSSILRIALTPSQYTEFNAWLAAAENRKLRRAEESVIAADTGDADGEADAGMVDAVQTALPGEQAKPVDSFMLEVTIIPE